MLLSVKKKILQTFVKDIWDNAFNSNIIPSLPENFGWHLVEVKYKIQWFEGDVSSTSIESVCINDEEEISDTEYESDSDIYSDKDEEQHFSLVQKHKQLLRHLQAIIYYMKVINLSDNVHYFVNFYV